MLAMTSSIRSHGYMILALQEMRGVIEFDGSYVNYRHLAILCEVLTSFVPFCRT